jgi:putative spermidine/putrescine transport system substrate-binding protein
LFFNPSATKPVESYADLWNPRFERQFSMVGTQTMPSVFMVIAAAASPF